MLNFANLIRSMEDRYIELMGAFIKGNISYEEYSELDSYNICMMALKRRFKLRQLLDIKVMTGKKVR